MIEKALDSNNDILIKNGTFATVTDGAQVVQHVRTRLQFYLEEWFLDKTVGTAWFQEIFVKPFNTIVAESIIKARISETPELSQITEFFMDLEDPSTRILKVTFSAETSFGLINSEEIFING